MKARRHFYLSLMTVLVLFFQVMSPGRVSADGETTPAPSDIPAETATPEQTAEPTEAVATEPPTVDATVDTPVEAVSSTPEPNNSNATDAIAPTVDPMETSTPIPPTDLPEATEEPTEPAVATPEPVETISSEEAVNPEQPTLPEVLQQLPEETSVVVLDENGQPLPLALQETADAIAQADPMWCPAGVAPGGFGCTGSYTSLESLLTDLSALNAGTGIGADGTIWIESSYDSAVNDPTATGFTLNGSALTNWANYSLGLQGGWSGILGDTTIGPNSVFSVPITVSNWNNTVYIANITANTVDINDTNGVVILADVTADDVNIKRQRGRVDVYNHTGNLNITDADINNNGLYSAGVNIHTLFGDVNVSNSVFHGNGFDGIWIENVNDVTINDSLSFHNGNNGLGIFNANNVTINNSMLNGNVANGSFIAYANSVTINNSASDGNAAYGAEMYSVGDVTFDTSTLNANGAGGSLIYYANSVAMSDSSSDGNGGYGTAVFDSGNITISRSTFNNNLFHGIYVTNAFGNIDLANITATATTSTYGDGAYLDNTGGTGNITLTGTNDFSNHSSWNSGMFVLSNGDVTLSGITSNNNGRGVNISQAGNVTITNGTFNDNVCQCEGSGAYVFASGNVLIGQSTFGRNSLYINSAGTVTSNNVSVSGAPGVGLGVETQGGDVVINNSRFINSVPDYSLSIFPYGDGADIFPNGGNVIVTDSEFSGNEWGLWVANGKQVSITSSVFDRNVPPMNIVDLAVSCALTAIGLSFPENVPISTRVNPDCTYLPPVTVVNKQEQQVIVTDQSTTVITQTAARGSQLLDASDSAKLIYHGKAVFWLECKNQKNYKINLPNGDRVDIYCPVSGKATIERLDNTTLPAELPTGYTFASAFQVEILQPESPLRRDPSTGDYEREPIPVITEGGHIMASFVAPPLQGSTFSILYWDEAGSRWIPLKDYLFGRQFKLIPESPTDERVILSGVFPNFRNLPHRVQVTTNFPGIFVLVQR